MAPEKAGRSRGREVAAISVVPARFTALHVLTLCAAAIAGSGASPEVSDLHGTTLAGGRPVANAVVWLDAPAAPARPARRTVLDQHNLRFSPHVLAVRVGTSVEFPNNDRVFHNVFSFRDGKVFDLGIYPVGAVRRVTFDKPGLSRIFCNIHPGMAAYVMAVDSPYFAVSDAGGSFTIEATIAGVYKYHAWRAGAPEAAGTWTGGSLSVNWP